jgi:hypothetical protein
LFFVKKGKHMKKRDFVLVPATFRERKNFWTETPRTLEEIEEAEKTAAESKRLEEKRRAAEEAAFQ